MNKRDERICNLICAAEIPLMCFLIVGMLGTFGFILLPPWPYYISHPWLGITGMLFALLATLCMGLLIASRIWVWRWGERINEQARQKLKNHPFRRFILAEWGISEQAKKGHGSNE